MGTAHIQDLPVASAAGVTSLQSSAFPSATTGGNTILVVSILFKGSAVSTSSVTDTAGNTYTQDKGLNYSNTSPTRANVSVWKAAGITGNAANKITVTPSASSGVVIMATEVSGLLTNSPLDGTGSSFSSGGSTSTTLAPGAFSTTNAADLLLACYGIDATQSSITPPSGWTALGTNLSGAVEAGMACWQIVSVTQTNLNPTITVPSATRYGAIGLAYQGTAPSAGGLLLKRRRRGYSP